jgi:hypothetical protein
MVNWWASPIDKANPGYTPFTFTSSFHAGVAPAGYAAFAFALGVTAGLFIRHTLPAMAVTLAVFTAVIISFPIWVRPHLIPPVTTTSAFAPASAMGLLPPSSSTHSLLLQGAQLTGLELGAVPSQPSSCLTESGPCAAGTCRPGNLQLLS